MLFCSSNIYVKCFCISVRKIPSWVFILSSLNQWKRLKSLRNQIVSKDTNSGQFNKPKANDFAIYFLLLNKSWNVLKRKKNYTFSHILRMLYNTCSPSLEKNSYKWEQCKPFYTKSPVCVYYGGKQFSLSVCSVQVRHWTQILECYFYHKYAYSCVIKIIEG